MILDGKALARQIRSELAVTVQALTARGHQPGLRILLVGDDPPSQVYVRNKLKAASAIGIDAQVCHLPVGTDETTAAQVIADWNRNPRVNGIIVQLPLPEPLDGERLISQIAPSKDVDGLTPTSIAGLASGRPSFLPATPAGIIELLVRNGITIPGKRVVIVGRGELVGRPLAQLLLLRGERGDATVTVCHTKTRDLGAICREAEILVAAVGRPQLITAAMVSPGAVVVDAGTSEVNGRLVGDVDFAAIEPIAQAITPVPGGVGPMTVAMLLVNVVKAARLQE